MDMPLTRAFVKSLPNFRKTPKATEALKKGVETGVDHYALMMVAASAQELTSGVMQQVIAAWSDFLKGNAATYKLSDLLTKYAFELTVASSSTPSEVSFAKSMATMRMLESRLIDNCGAHTDETLKALLVSWKMEMIRLVGSDEEFEQIHGEWTAAWSEVELLNADQLDDRETLTP